MTKKCCRCGLVKAYIEFHKNRKNKDGLDYRCKACKKIIDGLRAPQDEKRHREYSKQYHDSHIEEHKAYCKAYYRKHRKWKMKYARVYRQNNPNKMRAQRARRRARVKAADGTFTDSDILRQGESQRWKCWWCGKRCKRKYHVDHLVPLARGGHNGPSNIVISCPTCNLSKHDKLPDEWIGKLF